MAEPNPFLHPARKRFLELLDEVETQATVQEQEQGTLADPLEPFHRAEGWGIDPWIAAMHRVDTDIVQLQRQAVGMVGDPDAAKQAFLRIAVSALHARVLFEEGEDGDPLKLDDGDLADFLDKLVEQLGERAENLRRPEKPPVMSLDEQKAVVDAQHDLAETGPLDVAEFIAQDVDPNYNPDHALAPDEQLLSHPGDEPVDLDAAERALAREMTVMKQTAAGSSAVQLGGRHAGPAQTDPNLGEQGKH
jgi:hypothetical protein